MTENSEKERDARELDPLDPNDPPPQDRFCDVVLDGGVINGVVYPGFLMELARKFHFRSLGGTSVGAISAALAAACEFNRRYQGNNGFNEGLAKLPTELAKLMDEEAEVTKIRSLFQPDPKVQHLFDWFVDVLGTGLEYVKTQVAERQSPETKAKLIEPKSESSNFTKLVMLAWFKAVDHFGPNAWWLFWWMLAALDGVLLLTKVWAMTFAWQMILWQLLYLLGVIFLHPVCIAIVQVRRLIKLPGAGACNGMRASPENTEGLSEWLYEGIQKAANLPLDKPLTFANLWQAPCGPKASDGSQEPRSIDLRMITTCLSHGRIYELPLIDDDDAVVMFKLSELKPYFSTAVIAHLRRVSKPLNIDTCLLLRRKIIKRKQDLKNSQEELYEFKLKWRKARKKLKRQFLKPEDKKNGLNDPDIRQLPSSDLPIVVAARLSMSCPILFQNMPLIGFNFDVRTEDIDLVRLWFSDGGIGSNFPIHLFDKPIPRWPTFGVKILDESPRKDSKQKHLQAHIPFGHKDGSDDNLLYPRDKDRVLSRIYKGTGRNFLKILFGIYTSTKDGHDQSFVRMPDVRNRVVRVYLNNRAGNAFNLKISSKQIIDLAHDVGAYGGRLAAQAYLAQSPASTKYKWVNSWQDHRWVRFNMLTEGLRSYLHGFTHAIHLDALPGSVHCNSLIEQVLQSTQKPPLSSRSDPSDEVTLTQDQSTQLLEIINAISALEMQLQNLNMPQPYVPEPMPVLRFKPRY